MAQEEFTFEGPYLTITLAIKGEDAERVEELASAMAKMTENTAAGYLGGQAQKRTQQ